MTRGKNRAKLTRRTVDAVAVAALAAFPLVSNDLYYQTMLILTFLLAIGATGWNIMGGYAGYISLGNSAFIGLGAYTTGILAATATAMSVRRVSFARFFSWVMRRHPVWPSG